MSDPDRHHLPAGTETDPDPGVDPRTHTDASAAHDPLPRRTGGSRAGTVDGEATHVAPIVGRSEPSGRRPSAAVMFDDPTAKVVAFEFAAGQELGDHAAHHAHRDDAAPARVTPGPRPRASIRWSS